MYAKRAEGHPMVIPEHERRSRRSVLAAAAAAAVASAAGWLSHPGPVEALGEPLRLGVANNAGSDQTVLVANATGATFTLKTTNGVAGSTGIFGWSSATSGGVTRAISARVDGPNGDAIHARQLGATAGSGAAVRALGGQNDGLVASTARASKTAVTATAPGRALTASTSQPGAIAMHVTAAGDGSNALRAVALGADGRAVQGQGGLYGVYGLGQTGVFGGSQVGSGVVGYTEGPGQYAVYASGDAIVTGDLTVQGTLIQAAGGFVIDDPLTPAQRTLQHANVASSERLTVYSGNVTLDSRGEASIDLPAWFERLNEDVRYQLTSVGRHAPVYVKGPVTNGRFTIAGGSDGLVVSWQVMARRRDAWAAAHPLAVRAPKRGKLAGRYLHPIEHGRPASQGLPRVDIDSPLADGGAE